MEHNVSPMQLLITVVERGKGMTLIKKYEQFKIFHHIQAAGHGTAASHLLDTLGFGTPERDVIFSFGPRDTINQIMFFLKDEDRSSLAAPGIAFSTTLSGMTAIWAVGLSRISATEPERGEIFMEHENPHSLILVSVNQGYTETVMDTARAAGARGGTVIRGRWTGTEATKSFGGISIQAEKEVLLIVAPNKDRDAIMNAINKDYGMKSDAQAMVLSLPIDHMARLD